MLQEIQLPAKKNIFSQTCMPLLLHVRSYPSHRAIDNTELLAYSHVLECLHDNHPPVDGHNLADKLITPCWAIHVIIIL